MDLSNKTELSRQRIILEDGRIGELVLYDVKDYGRMEILENVEVVNGKFRQSRSLMPFCYLDKKPSDFEFNIYGQDTTEMKQYANAFIVNYEKWKVKGKGLYIYSKTKGTGKTMLACCLANAIMEKYGICVKFINVPELLEMTKKSWQSWTEQEELESIRKAEILIIDDIGVELKKEWVDVELYRLINWRCENKHVTIFTSNVDIDDLKLDERIIGRIAEMCVLLKMPEVSIRRIKAKQENELFIQELLK